MIMIKKLSIISLFLAVAAIVFFILRSDEKFFVKQPIERTVIKLINPGDTFDRIAKDMGLATDTVSAILEKSRGVYDLASIRSGKELAFVFSVLDNDLNKLVYQIDSEKELIIAESAEEADPSTGSGQGHAEWQAKVQLIPYEIKERTSETAINSSLYEAFLENNWDIRLALALAETFAWQIDFAADIQKGDTFKVIYEERYRDDQYVMPGKILAASFSNAGKIFRGFYFGSDNTKPGHYDEEGNSLQKEFLKSPLQYKYISSGFSYARLNPITKQVSSHRGIDYAANAGTPAVSVGEGTIIQAGWNGYYGISATVRHNDTYKTVYGHFQSLAKGIKVGAKVKQGQVIGYVGSTGQATGPHLHYEMHKFNQYVNPFLVEIPPGEPIAEEDRAAFQEITNKYRL